MYASLNAHYKCLFLYKTVWSFKKTSELYEWICDVSFMQLSFFPLDYISSTCLVLDFEVIMSTTAAS